MLNKKKASLLIGLVTILIIANFLLDEPIIRLPGTRTPPQFDVRTQQQAEEELGGVVPDESNLFHSPAAAVDEGIYFQDPAPTFEESNAEVNKIREDLPFLVDNMSFSVRTGGRLDVLSIHINEINYNEAEANDSNPQYKAFVEALKRARAELVRRGVNPDKLLVSFGTRQYIVNTANNWARVSNVF